MSPAGELRGVTKRYGDLVVLRSVDLTIEAGELVAVVGPSGSGKTTLLQIMGTLDRPSDGTVHIGGRAVTGTSDRWLSGVRAHELGFVFQQFHLTPTLSAVDNVAAGLLYTGTPARRRELAVAALQRVGLGHRLRYRPGELSGGECQRVAIARAVLGEPSVILADEPTGNLDSRSGAGVVDVLRGLNAGGTTVVVITHDREVAAHLPRVVGIRDGEVRS